MAKKRGVLPRGSVLPRLAPHLLHGIPECPDCHNKAVRWRGSWVCRLCFGLSDGRSDKQIPLESVFPNRAARRASS